MSLDLVTNQIQLTAYNVDGLELFFTVDRKVRASQSAIARMCNVTEATIRNDLNAIEIKGLKLDVVYAQTSSTGGGKQSKLHPAGIIKVLLKKRNPELLEKFLDFGIDEGLAQMAGVPLPVVKPESLLTQAQALREMAQKAIAWANVMEYGSDNPGFQREVEAVSVTDNSKSDTVWLSLKEMATIRNIELTKEKSQIIGRIMADKYKVNKEVATAPKQKYNYKQANGKHQSMVVGAYPEEMLTTFDSIIKALELV